MNERRAVTSAHDHLRPLPYQGTTGWVENGWGGTEPLPVAISTDDLGRSMVNTAWVIPKRMYKLMKRAMAEERLALSVIVVVGHDGKVAEMSIVVPKVQLIPDQRMAQHARVLTIAALLLAQTAPAAACHRFSVWRYPTPQRCAVAHVAKPAARAMVPAAPAVATAPHDPAVDEEAERAAAMEQLRVELRRVH
jgi:creatinine amidohydrolase/Fe(II)-dependent formamide hydrolase-like protein